MVLSHVMEGLLRMSVDDKLEAGLAERWEVTHPRDFLAARECALERRPTYYRRGLYFFLKTALRLKPHRSMRFCCTPSKMAVR